MGRPPCCGNNGLKKGPWTTEEDKKMVDYIERHGHGSWRALPKLAGLNRCGKSCRLRWTNYLLRPHIKRGKFSQEEEQTIINLHSHLGNKWSAIADHLPGRTDNEIKNYWNTHLRKRLLHMGIDPITHRPRTDLTMLANFAAHNINSLDNTGTQLAKLQLLQNIFHVLVGTNGLNPNPNTVHPSAETLLDPNAALFGSSFAPNTINHDHHLLESHLQRISSQPTEGITNTTPFHPCNATSSAFGNVEPAAAETENHMPALVPTSPDINPSVNQTQKKTTLNGNKKNEASNLYSTITTNNTTFNVWNEIMDEEGGNSYWRDIIDQESPPTWPITS